MTFNRKTWRAASHNATFMVGAGLVLLIILMALAAPLLAHANPTGLNLGQRLKGPSAVHPFGTDEMGRDMYSRVVWGSRISLRVGLIVIAIAGGVGITLGAIAGFVGGKVDNVIMRVTDMFLAFPSLILALAIAAALGPGITNAMIAVTSSWWPWYARLTRSLVMPLKERQYVEAATASGLTDSRILVHHILPNCLAPLIVQATMDMGYVVLTTASLSFIGLGAQPPTPEWGAMVAAGRRFILDQWWYATFPGVAIFLTVLGFSLLGDGLRDIIDPLTSGNGR